MKIETRLGKTTKIGYTQESRTDAPVGASSRIPKDFVVNTKEGLTPIDTFMTTQDPFIAFARGFFRGLGIVAKMVLFCVICATTFMLIINIIQ